MDGIPEFSALSLWTTASFDCQGRRVLSRRRMRATAAPLKRPGDIVTFACGSRYIIEAVLGSGGMGTVYRARRESDGRVVALKLALQHDSNGQKYLRREAKNLCRLDNHNIIKLLEHGSAGPGDYCLAMEYVEGQSLDRILIQGPLPPKRAVAICLQIAEALEHCHAAGLVHGDLKPANVMISQIDGVDLVYLLDFGTAGTENRGRSHPYKSSPLSIFYMSPEQMLNEPHTRKSDTYQLGLMFFECLFGHLPFNPSLRDAVKYRLKGKGPSLPREHRLSTSPSWSRLSRILRRALSRCQSTRYLNASDFAADLRRLNALLDNKE